MIVVTLTYCLVACGLGMYLLSRKGSDNIDLAVAVVAIVGIIAATVGYRALAGEIPTEGELVTVYKTGADGEMAVCLVTGQNSESIDLRCPLGTGDDIILEEGE